jgi:flagellar motor component MotA
MFRRSLPVMIAIGQAFSGKLTADFYDSIAETEKDVEKLVSKSKDKTADINKLKEMAKSARKKRDGTNRKHS